MRETEKRNEGEENGLPATPPRPVSAVGFFADHAMKLEGMRVAAQVRLRHLERNRQTDEDTLELFRRAKELEDFVDGRLNYFVYGHPTAKWWQRVSGCHPQLMGKIIGEIELFGRFYEAGDPMIPRYVRRAAQKSEDGKSYVWVEGIERFTTPAKLLKFAGMLPESRRVFGEKADHSIALKSLLHRLTVYGFMMAKERYYDHYARYKAWRRAKLQEEGVQVLPTPKGRFCPACNKEVQVPRTTFYCPTCNTKLGMKLEPEGILWAGHFDNMCRRKIKVLFLCHLWAVWREVLDLPLREPYAMEHLGHTTPISPWDMCDLSEDVVITMDEAKVCREERKKPRGQRGRRSKAGREADSAGTA
jgi:hypothetical protein